MSLEDFNKRVLPVKNKLYRFALKFMGDKAEAEDIIQDVLVKAWKQGDKLSTYTNIEAWCMRLVKNQSLDRLRSWQYRTTNPIKENHEIATEDKSPYQSAEMGNRMKNIHAIIESLPEKQKQIIHLRDIEGLPYQQIAEILEIDLTQVKVYLFRARAAIRTKLLNVEAYGTR